MKPLRAGENSDWVRYNCLNTVRLLAAIEVLYRHSIFHLHIGPIPILGEFISFFQGIPVFFTLSGFLIWGSIKKSSSYGDYLKKRFWKIYPELWIAVIVEIIVILLLYHEPVNWAQMGAFTITQSTIFQFWTPDFLRGYGCGCPNGSLWTICVLIQFYFIDYYIYKLLHGRKLLVWIIAILISLCGSVALPMIENRIGVPELINKLINQTLLPYLWMFLSASFVAEKKELVIPFLKKYWLLFVIILLAKVYLFKWDVYASWPILGSTLLFLGLIGFAYSFPILNIKLDISYGIYLYHMTIINALIVFEYSDKIWLFFFVLVSTASIALLSTKTVGAWAQRKKMKLCNYVKIIG